MLYQLSYTPSGEARSNRKAKKAQGASTPAMPPNAHLPERKNAMLTLGEAARNVPDCRRLREKARPEESLAKRRNARADKQGNAMKKIIAVAALVVAGYAAPTVAVQAA